MARTAAEMVAEATQRIENPSVDQVAAEVAGGDALLVDLRKPGERAQFGAIPSAVHAPRGMPESRADPTSAYHRPEFDPGRRVVMHCAGGHSAPAANALQQLGYSNAAHLDGGFSARHPSGRPVRGAAE